MKRFFSPDEIYPSIREVSVKELRFRNIRIVFCDLDNTLARWNDPLVPVFARAFSNMLVDNQILLCILSNNKGGRVAEAARALHAMYVPRAKKPLPFSIKKTLKKKGIPPENAVMIGDQILTDILAGNLAGVHSILVNPVDPSHEFQGTKINRFFERIVCRLFRIHRVESTE